MAMVTINPVTGEELERFVEIDDGCSRQLRA